MICVEQTRTVGSVAFPNWPHIRRINLQDKRALSTFPDGMLAIHFPTEANPLSQKTNAIMAQIENAVSVRLFLVTQF